MSKKHKKRRFERPVQTPEEEQEAIDRLFKAIESEPKQVEEFPLEAEIVKDMLLNEVESEPKAQVVPEVEVVIPPQISVKTSSTVNFRTQPSKEATIIFAAQKGTKFKLIEATDEWSHLKFTDGKVVAFGWIMTQYLIKEN